MKNNLIKVLIVMATAFGIGFNAESQRHIRLFPDVLFNSVPEPITVFAEKYVGKILEMDDAEKARRLEFDEVNFSFPLTEDAIASLLDAEQISMALHDGKTYEIFWIKGEDAFASMSFPASYNLIRFTDQAESFKAMKDALAEALLVTQRKDDYAGLTEFNRNNVVQKSGETFYLGHLTTDTYIDALTKRPVWGMDLPKESLANLFVAGENMAPVNVSLTVEGYDKETFIINIPFAALENVLKAEGNVPYFGISDEGANGDIYAVALYHNPLYAYTHSLEVTLPADQLSADVPTLKIKMLPYIKLHNLKNLWSDNEE